MKVFVTGVTGQLGHDCVIELVRQGYTVFGSGSRKYNDINNSVIGAGDQFEHGAMFRFVPGEYEYSSFEDQETICCVCDKPKEVPYIQLDITDREAVMSTIKALKPDAVIHCAAWTAVDAAEEEENRAKVFATNALGTRYIAEAAESINAKMIYISTDYVFDGKGERPWQPDDKTYHPINVYGKSKLEGELAVSSILSKFFIVRIAWVFGLNGKNFIKTMISVGKSHDSVRVVNDQIGTPTYTVDLARLLAEMVKTEKYGYYHATNEGGYISWYDFCCEIYRQYGLKTKVIPVTTAEYGLSKAARPENSRLDRSKLVKAGFTPLPSWQDAVSRYLKEAQL